MGHGDRGVEGDGLAVRGDGPIQVSLVQECVAEIEVGDSVLLVEGDGLAKFNDRSFIIMLLVTQERAEGERAQMSFGASTAAFLKWTKASSSFPCLSRAGPSWW
jgi:hypothetical protein